MSEKSGQDLTVQSKVEKSFFIACVLRGSIGPFLYEDGKHARDFSFFFFTLMQVGSVISLHLYSSVCVCLKLEFSTCFHDQCQKGLNNRLPESY